MNKNKNFNIGNRILNLRKSKGFSQEQLALSADISPTYLGLLERNVKTPTTRVLGQICDALNISFHDFFTDTPLNTTTVVDNISLQILAQLSNESDEEKLLILKIVKDIIKLKYHSEK